MTKEDALRVIFQCATEYEKNLAGRNLLFVVGEVQHPNWIEAAFSASGYLHLTGVKVSADIKPRKFFTMCKNRRLSINDFEMASDGTTDLKLSVLPFLVKKDLSARMVGAHNQQTRFLYTDKLIGSVNKGCMGFVQAQENSRYYVPNTTINEDIRDITSRPQERIILACEKLRTDPKYCNIVYLANGIKIENIRFPVFLSDLLLLSQSVYRL